MKIKSSAFCLSLNIFVKQAKETLKLIAENEDNIFGFDAKMVLKEAEKKGYLNMYPGQTTNRLT